MQRGKNYKNRLRLAEVIVKNKMSRFLWFTVYINVLMYINYLFSHN